MYFSTKLLAHTKFLNSSLRTFHIFSHGKADPIKQTYPSYPIQSGPLPQRERGQVNRRTHLE